MSTYSLSRSAHAIASSLGTDSVRTEENTETLVEAAVRQNVPPRAPAVTQESLQVATRMKVLLGSTGSVVVVTGLSAADASATATADIAASLAAIDRSSRVLLVYAIERREGEADTAADRLPGLINILEGAAALEDVVQHGELDNLITLFVGAGRQSLSALLSSAHANVVFQQLREKYRYILMDAGVIRSGPAGMLLASLSDGVIASLAAGKHHQHEIRDFQKEMRRLSINLLGFVLTE